MLSITLGRHLSENLASLVIILDYNSPDTFILSLYLPTNSSIIYSFYYLPALLFLSFENPTTSPYYYFFSISEMYLPQSSTSNRAALAVANRPTAETYVLWYVALSMAPVLATIALLFVCVKFNYKRIIKWVRTKLAARRVTGDQHHRSPAMISKSQGYENILKLSGICIPCWKILFHSANYIVTYEYDVVICLL